MHSNFVIQVVRVVRIKDWTAWSLLCFAIVLLVPPSMGYADIAGTDNASEAAYDDGWMSGDDGAASGDAFGAWTLSSSSTAGFFIGDSTGLGSPGADINVGGESFGMFGASGSSASANRSLNGGSLGVGHSFEFDLAVNFRNGNKGVDVFDGGTNIFNFNIGGDDHIVNNAATGNGSIGNSYSAETAFRVRLTQTSISGGTWSITRSGGVTDLDTGTYSGQVDSFTFYVAGTDGGSPNDLFVNNLEVAIPEPTSVITLSLLATGMLCKRRRR